jgi:hypothetical protein
LKQPYERLCELFEITLNQLCQINGGITTLPSSIMLWLMMLYHLVAGRDLLHDPCETGWLEKAILLVEADSWSEGHEILRSVMWVDFVHDSVGMEAFIAAKGPLDEVKDSRS